MIYKHLRKSKTIFKASFQKLTSVLKEVQGVSSIIAKRKLLEEFYIHQNPDNQKSIINILNFIRDKPKTGIASATLTEFFKNKYVLTEEQGKSPLQSIIDEKFQDKQKSGQSLVQIKQVQLFLQFLTQCEGKNSKNKKIQKLDQLISQMKNQQAKILIRLLLKKLRIGIQQKSFQFKHKLQQKNNQSQVIDQTKVQVPKIDLMLAKPLRSLQEVFKFCQGKEKQKLIADYKYDGQRTLIVYKKGVGIELMSRRKKIQTDIYKPLSQVLYTELQKLPQIDSIQIDGQIVCVSAEEEPLMMQTLINKRGKQYTQQSSQKVIIYGFDVLQYNGENYLNKQLIQRRKMIPQTNHLKLTQFLIFQYPQQKQKLLEYFKEVLKKKYEGLIIKGEKDLYFVNGSRRHWGKFKKGCKIQNTDTGQIDLDLVVMGAFMGEGKRKNVFSAYLLGTYHEGKLQPVSKVGSGFKDEQLQELTNKFQKIVIKQRPQEYKIPETLRVDYYIQPKYVFKVVCQDLSRSPLYDLSYEENQGGISLRFPVFQCIRQDKDPKSCTSADLFNYIQKQSGNK